MPAKNPVIAVVVPREVAAVIKRLAGLRGESRSAVVRGFLIEAQPVLERVCNLLDLAYRTDKSALVEWHKDLMQAQVELEGQAMDAMTRMDALADGPVSVPKPGRPPATSEGRGPGVARSRPPRRPGKRHA